MSLGELARRLDERFRLLGGGRRDVPARQRTLQDTVEWSYKLLSAQEQRLFDRASVFYGGFTAAAAAAVSGQADTAEVEEVVWHLVDRSLLRLARGGVTSRYEMLETLRHYGQGRLAAEDELDSARAAHLSYFVELAEAAEPHLRARDEAAWVDILEQELPNLVPPISTPCARAPPARRPGLVAALHDFAMWRQLFELGGWAEATLPLVGDDAARTPLLCATAGWGRCIAGDFEAAMALAERGLAAERRAAPSAAGSTTSSPTARTSGGRRHRIGPFGRRDPPGPGQRRPYRLSYVLADNGTHAGLLGGRTSPSLRAAEALALARRLDNPTAISMAYLCHGFQQREHDPHAAIDWFRRAAEIADTVKSRWTAGIGRGELGLLLSLHGDPAEALTLLHPQLVGFRRAGDISRVRACIRWAIPALCRLAPNDRRSDIVRLTPEPALGRGSSIHSSIGQ